jgi:hypothetical protein
VWLLRLAGWPRLEQWAGDLDPLAALASADSYLLGAFLVSVQSPPPEGPAASLPSRRPHATTAA